MLRFVSRGGCAQSMLERGEEDSFPLHGRRREDAIFGTIHPRSGNFDDDFDE